MFLIKLKSGDTHWTEGYQENNGWLVYDTRSKEGKVQKHQVSKTEVTEIVETEVDQKLKRSKE